jgi:hypothetical protein
MPPKRILAADGDNTATDMTSHPPSPVKKNKLTKTPSATARPGRLTIYHHHEFLTTETHTLTDVIDKHDLFLNNIRLDVQGTATSARLQRVGYAEMPNRRRPGTNVIWKDGAYNRHLLSRDLDVDNLAPAAEVPGIITDYLMQENRHPTAPTEIIVVDTNGITPLDNCTYINRDYCDT